MSYFEPDPLYPQLSGATPMGGFGYAFPGVPVQQVRSSLRSYPFLTNQPLALRYGVRRTESGARRGVSYAVGVRGLGLGEILESAGTFAAGGVGGWLLGAAFGFAAGYLVCKHFSDAIEGPSAGPTRPRYKGTIRVKEGSSRKALPPPKNPIEAEIVGELESA